MENPALYLAEICQHIHEVFVLNVTPSTVCRLLRSYGITRKKIRCIALHYKGVKHFGEHLAPVVPPGRNVVVFFHRSQTLRRQNAHAETDSSGDHKADTRTQELGYMQGGPVPCDLTRDMYAFPEFRTESATSVLFQRN